MRVLHVTPHPDAYNGISEYSTSFGRAMTEHGGVTIERLYFTEGELTSKEIGARLASFDLNSFDVIHGEIGVGTNAVFYAMRHFARRRRGGMLVTLHDPPLVVFSPTLDLFRYSVTGMLNKAVRKLVTDPLFNTACLPSFATRIRNFVVLNRGALRATERRFPDAAVCYVPLIASAQRRPPASGPLTDVLFYGFVARAKGIDLAIRAVYEIRKRGTRVRLHVVGGCLDQAYQQQLLDLTDRLSLRDNIVWHGFVDEPHLDALLSCGSMVVMPYRETESYGASAAVVRAMEHGLPVILSDTRRFTGEYDDGVDALMFREADVEDLADKMQEVIANDDLRNKLIEGSGRRIALVHDPKVVSASFRAVYDALG